MYRIVGKFGQLTLFENLVKEIWQTNRSANMLLIINTNFSLVNHGQFAKFVNLSFCQTFPLYGIRVQKIMSTKFFYGSALLI